MSFSYEQLASAKRIRTASELQNINISTLAKGMYIVKIIASGTVQTQKLVVQ